MTQGETTLRVLDLRAVLVFVALISLCLSRNVGPQFLPLPGLTPYLAETGSENDPTTASKSPSRESDGFRVPMLSAAQKRASTELQAQHLATAALANGIAQTLGFQTNRDSDSTLLLSGPTHVAQPPGRAPPHLV